MLQTIIKVGSLTLFQKSRILVRIAWLNAEANRGLAIGAALRECVVRRERYGSAMVASDTRERKIFMPVTVKKR